MEKYLKGTYKKSIFKSETDYYIGLFKVLETNISNESEVIDKTITFTGYFEELNPDQNYIFYGKFVINHKYGKQFEVSYYEILPPSEEEDLISFLSSDLFKGIGEKKAKRIVKALGTHVISLITQDKYILKGIPSISNNDINNIYDTLINYDASYQIIKELSSFGFNPKDRLSIYKKYKNNTLEVLNNNIYDLLDEIRTLNFKKIDDIALNNNLKKDDQRRIKAAIIYVMKEYCFYHADTYMLNGDIFTYTEKVLNYQLPTIEFDEALNDLITNNKVICFDDKYFLKMYYDAEKLIAERIKYLQSKEETNLEPKLEELENLYNIKYNLDQKAAILKSINSSFLIITGGPGTGKTTIIKSIVKLLRELNPRFSDEDITLLAPTGRASKRLEELTNYSSSTIHRFLKWNKELDTFAVNEHNLAKSKILIIDEASMLDVNLFSNLLKGVTINTKIILIGDVDQLPSISPGQVLKDLINGGCNTIILEEIHRREKGSKINLLASHIRDGNSLELDNESDEIEFIEPDNSNYVKTEIESLLTRFDDLNNLDLQFLAPMYKTKNGIDEMNIFLQNIYNPKDKLKTEIRINNVLYREYDKVIQLVNNPDQGIYNGDIGYIFNINTKKKEVTIIFDDNVVIYNQSTFNTFKHAFIISIHKAQGSEFDHVVILILEEFKRMLYQKLIYTGITRAKKNLYIIGNKMTFKGAVSNQLEDNRKTALPYFLNTK